MQSESDPTAAGAAFPELLESRLREKLRTRLQRMCLWGAVLGALAVKLAWARVVFVLWLAFSLISLAGLLFGIRVAKRLRVTGQAGPVPSPVRDPGVIEIEAEVLDAPSRTSAPDGEAQRADP